MKTILEATAGKIIEYRIPDKIYPKVKQYLTYFKAMNVFKNMPEVLKRLTEGELRQIQIRVKTEMPGFNADDHKLFFSDVDDSKWKEYIKQ